MMRGQVVTGGHPCRSGANRRARKGDTWLEATG